MKQKKMVETRSTGSQTGMAGMLSTASPTENYEPNQTKNCTSTFQTNNPKGIASHSLSEGRTLQAPPYGVRRQSAAATAL